jgi:uncharacterized membrane protein YccC
MRPAAYLLDHLLDRILASDPSLERLRSSLRALLTALVCAGLFLLITRMAGLKYTLSLAGVVVPMMSVVSLQDAGRREQQITMAWVPVMASVALVVGTLVADNPWLSGVLFLVTIFNSFEMRRFGPRGAGLGTVSYQSFFYAMLFKNPPDQAGWLPVFVFIGCALAFAIHFWIVPEHPGRMLRSELRAYRARIAVLLHDLARWLERDDKAGAKRVDAHLAALNAQSLALDARLAGFSAGEDSGGPQAQADAARLRDHVLRCELAAETIADVARGVGGDARRQALADRLRELAASAGKDAPPVDGAAWAARLALPLDARWRLQRAAEALAGMAPWRDALPAMRDEQRPRASPARAAAKPRPWFDESTRRALQACAAALGAMAAGYAISPSHWYWAVFAAFVVFTRSGTVGQTLSGAWRQVLASLAGLCLGVLFAELVHGDRTLELILLFVFVAAGFYAFRGLQNVYTALLTAMLAMVYELMGMNSPELLVLRLAETAAGALIAVLSARLVLPVRTGDESDSKGADLLHAAGRLLASSFAEGRRPPLHAALRDLDRTLGALRQALGPVTGASYPASKDAHRARLRRLSRLAFCLRHFYNLVASHAPGLAHAREVRAAARALAPRLDAEAARLRAPGAGAFAPAQPGPAVAAFPPPDPAGASDMQGDAPAQQIACGLLEEAAELSQLGHAPAPRRSGEGGRLRFPPS